MSCHPSISSLLEYGKEGETKLLSSISAYVGEPVTKTKGVFDNMDFISESFFCELKRRSKDYSYCDEKIKKEGWLISSSKVIKGWEEIAKGKRVFFFYFWTWDKSLWVYELQEGDFTQDGSHFIPKGHYDTMLHVTIPQDKWIRCGELSDVVFEEDVCWIEWRKLIRVWKGCDGKMEKELLQYRRKLFFETLRDKSIDKFDPVSEWDFDCILDNDGTKHCICSAPIQYLYQIKNRFNQETVIVGSECIKRWLNGLVRCSLCQCNLGNISKRLKTQNFHCRDCKLRLERQAKYEEEEQKTKRIKKLGSLHLFWYGPYYMKKFSAVIEDIPYVEKLLNIQEKTKTLEAFEEYVNLVYEVTTQEVSEPVELS